MRDYTNDPGYTVVCGYDLPPEVFLEADLHHQVMFIAHSLTFEDAFHVVRTLREKGQQDMTYMAIPTDLLQALNRNLKPVQWNVEEPEVEDRTGYSLWNYLEGMELFAVYTRVKDDPYYLAGVFQELAYAIDFAKELMSRDIFDEVRVEQPSEEWSM